MKTVSISDRIGAATGAVYVLLVCIGNQLSEGSSTDPHPSGAKDLAAFNASPTVADAVGFRMEVASFIALMFFVGWLVHALRSRRGGWHWLPGVVGVAGVTMLAIKLGSAAPIMVADVDHGQLTPTLARVLADMNGSSFVVTFLPTAVLSVAAGAAMLGNGLAGRVAGWSGIVIGVLGIAAPVGTGLDPLGTNPMPFLAGLLWILAVSVRLAVWGPKHAASDSVPVVVGEPAGAIA